MIRKTGFFAAPGEFRRRAKRGGFSGATAGTLIFATRVREKLNYLGANVR
jgi:hypothetical protein